MDMTQPPAAAKLHTQVGCSQCGERFRLLRDSGFSHCKDHQHATAMTHTEVWQASCEAKRWGSVPPLTSAQVAAMDETMTAAIQPPAPYVRPVRDDKEVLQAFAGYADAVMARRRADDKRTKAERIQDALRFDGPPPTLEELLSILAGVHLLVGQVNGRYDDLSFSKAGDKIDEAYQAIEDEYAEFQELEAEREASVRII